VEWLRNQGEIVWFSESDEGMYDALNKALCRARGDIISYLNSDEQYLPDALNAVDDYFRRNPEVDILFGGSLIIGGNRELLSYRKPYPVRWWYVQASHLYVLSCAMFFRRALIEQGMRFDHGLRYVGDADFVVRVLRKGYRSGIMNRCLSSFAMTGQNIGGTESARRELCEFRARGPFWVRFFRFPLNLLRWSEKCLHGAYVRPSQVICSLYTTDLECRTSISATNVPTSWPK
jgi:glycosyltransferase involved in cell wall biosynthesis